MTARSSCHRVLFALALTALSLTASPASAQLPGQSRTQPIPRLRASLPGFPDPVALDTVAQFREFRAPMGAVYTAAVATLKELDIPMAVQDSLHGIVGSLSYTKMRRLAGKQMSQSVSCGSGMTGPNADSYRIYLATMVMMEPTATGGTKVAIALVASAQDIQGSSKDPVPCGTSGFTETTIENAIRARVR